jgi:geranylgeranyl pyrophosphate synthase
LALPSPTHGARGYVSDGSSNPSGPTSIQDLSKSVIVQRLGTKWQREGDDISQWSTAPTRGEASGSGGGDSCINSLLQSLLGPKFQERIQSDPFTMIEPDLMLVNQNIKRLVRTEHPVLSELTKYFFDLPGKRFRPVVVLLLSHAINSQTAPTSAGRVRANSEQIKLAEIVELVHAACLLHDDVIDESLTRRGAASVNARYGNKLAILGGDFMLSRACLNLARLRHHDVSELLATTISELVEGEFMQVTPSNPTSFAQYLKKTYLQTGSLITSGCRAAALLGQADPELLEHATAFGKNLGMAFQFFDDILDFTGTEQSLGKPANVDLSLGLATGPVLFALTEFPQLQSLIERRFNLPGDVEEARELVLRSKGLEKTRELALSHCTEAIQALSRFQASSARDALALITHKILDRTC